MELASRTLNGMKSLMAEVMGEGEGLREGQSGSKDVVAPGRQIYAIGTLKALKYSTLVKRPKRLPPLKEWFGEDELPPTSTPGSTHRQHAHDHQERTKSGHHHGEAVDEVVVGQNHRRRGGEASSSSFSPSKDSFMAMAHPRDRHDGHASRSRADDHGEGRAAGRQFGGGARETAAGKDASGPGRSRAWADKPHVEDGKGDAKGLRAQSEGQNWREAGRADKREWVQSKGSDSRRDKTLDATRSATFTNKFGRLGEQDHQTPAWMDYNEESPPKGNSKSNRQRHFESEEDARDAETFGSLDDQGVGEAPELAHWAQNGVDEMQAFKERMRREEQKKNDPGKGARTSQLSEEAKQDVVTKPPGLDIVKDDPPVAVQRVPTKTVEVPSVRSSRFAKFFTEKQAEDPLSHPSQTAMSHPQQMPGAPVGALEAFLRQAPSGPSNPMPVDPPPGLGPEPLSKAGAGPPNQDMMRVVAMLGGLTAEPKPPQAVSMPAASQPTTVKAARESGTGIAPATSTAAAKQKSRFFGGDVPTAVLRAGKTTKADKDRNANSPSGSRSASPAPATGPAPAESSSAKVTAKREGITEAGSLQTARSGPPPSEAPPGWVHDKRQVGPTADPNLGPMRMRNDGRYPVAHAIPSGGRPPYPYEPYPPPGPLPPHMMYGPMPPDVQFMRGPPPPSYRGPPLHGPDQGARPYPGGPLPHHAHALPHGNMPGPPPPGLDPFSHVRAGHPGAEAKMGGPMIRSDQPQSARQYDAAGQQRASRLVPSQQPNGQPDLMKLLLGGDR